VPTIALKELGDQPFPNLLRGLLNPDPRARLTARQALEHPLFAKFGLPVPEVRVIDIAEALPVETEGGDEVDDAVPVEAENESPNNFPKSARKNRCNGRNRKRDRVLEKRAKVIDSACRHLGSENPTTPRAALEYCQALAELDDTIDDLSQSQSLLHCAVLAFRFFELEVLDLDELDAETNGTFAKWTLEDYVDDEATIFMILDFCLYPRNT